MNLGNFERGVQLYELGRYKDAISYLSKNPNTWESKYYIAESYFALEETKKAKEVTSSLLSEMPNNPHIFFLQSRIALEEDKKRDALTYINQAIELDPYESDYFGLKAAIFLQLKKFEKGLDFANEGLKIDAKNTLCLNIRAQLLTKLNRISEADETVENLLFDNPDDAYSHSNVGWVALEKNDIPNALTHFKEALRQNPNFEYAREGMSTALKAKNKIYNLYLKYAFWIGNKSSKSQWGFLIGIYVIYRISFKFLTASGMTYLAIPLFIAYLLFALGTWIMEPMSNAILSFDNYGKYLLSKKENTSGSIFILLVSIGFFTIIAYFISKIDFFLPIATACFCSLIPLPRAFLLDSSKARNFGLIFGTIILTIGIFGIFIFGNATTAALGALIAMVAFTWISSFFE